MKHHLKQKKQGLYNPINEHDSCGVGFVANIHGKQSHKIISQGLELLTNLTELMEEQNALLRAQKSS